MINKDTAQVTEKISFHEFKNEILADYRLAQLSRQLSIAGRKEVLTGKAKFGIFGDGKELPQIAMSKVYHNGDWRSGYYRDQTFMLASGIINPLEFFCQLYGVTDEILNPGNAGRSFNNHYATRNVDDEGDWIDQTEQKNTAADLSPTAGQMPRVLGLALASKFYRKYPELDEEKLFTNAGNEIVFATIGDASTSEGHFFEVMNALAIKQVPAIVTIYDDGYGISVEKEVQTVKSSISDALKGFEREENKNGLIIYKVKGWDYVELCRVYEEGAKLCREKHIPVLVHVEELTQPQGHSTSGSHERYKSESRLQWEAEHDCNLKMKQWILKKAIATEEELSQIEEDAQKEVATAKNKAWKIFQKPLLKQRQDVIDIVTEKDCKCKGHNLSRIETNLKNLKRLKSLQRRDVTSSVRKMLRNVCADCAVTSDLKQKLILWLNNNYVYKHEGYSSKLYLENEASVLNVDSVAPEYEENAAEVAGREILRDNYRMLLKKKKRLVIFGEDVGKIGGVNQTYEGLQKEFGIDRIFDTGIREASIIGKGIGLAFRGFRPIAEIQYFDYLLYGLQALSDDLATLHWRTGGVQSAPLIITTRGHRLEGIWHSGSPLSMVINSIRGIYVCVPRNMTQAAGFYNTLLEAKDPALVIEPLNGYRLKEKVPTNLGEFKVPLGVPEILNEGNDITIVTYGSCVRIAQDAIIQLKEKGISVELIDVQTLLPFDLTGVISKSIMKTNRVLFFDEDVPGGATAFMMQKVLEEQGGYKYLDAAPKTLTAKEHRPAYSSDGDYYSNPNVEDVFDTVYTIMNETYPNKFPLYY